MEILFIFSGAVFFPAFLFMLSRYLRKWRYEVRVYEFIKFVNAHRIYTDTITALGKIDKYYLKDVDELITNYFSRLINSNSKIDPWEIRATMEFSLSGLQKDVVMNYWYTAIRNKDIEVLIKIYTDILSELVLAQLTDKQTFSSCQLFINDIINANKGNRLFFNELIKAVENFIKSKELGKDMSISAKHLYELNLALLRTKMPTQNEAGMMSS